MQDKKPQTIYLKDYTVPEYLIESVELTVILDELKTRVVSKLTIQKNPKSKVDNAALVLHGESLELVSVAMDGVALNEAQYKQSTESLSIDNVPQEQVFVLAIENTVNPKSNTSLEGLYLSSTMLCTQ